MRVQIVIWCKGSEGQRFWGHNAQASRTRVLKCRAVKKRHFNQGIGEQTKGIMLQTSNAP